MTRYAMVRSRAAPVLWLLLLLLVLLLAAAVEAQYGYGSRGYSRRGYWNSPYNEERDDNGYGGGYRKRFLKAWIRG